MRSKLSTWILTAETTISQVKTYTNHLDIMMNLRTMLGISLKNVGKFQ